MSNSNSGAKHSTDSAEAQTRRNWWHNAKDFIVSNCPMFDMGDNNKLNISENHINAGVVVVLERLISSVSHIDQGGAQESNEQSQHPGTSAAQGNSGSGSGEPLVTVARQPTPVPTPPDPDNAFESEASSSKAYSSRAHTRSHVYSLEMMIHGAGYPLYMPTPSRGLSAGYRKKGVRVGDVGIITANGAFDFLFNACKHNDPSDAGVNPFILPDGFQLFNAVKRDRDEFDPGICLHSTHVSEIDDHDSSSAFQCSTKGAILALPTGATVYEARNIRQLGRHAARCAASWYEYALNEGGRDISNGSLYFVTECTKSKNWGIAVFYGNAVANNDHRAIFDSETCQWKYRGKTDARVGPKPKDIVLLDDDEPNQCVFLRGFRPDIWDKLNAIDVTCQDGVSPPPPSTGTTTHSPMHGMASSQTYSPHQMPNSDHSTQATPTKVTEAFGNPHRPGSWLGQVMLKEEFKETVPLHPSDPINVMLLHLKPEASVALVHDNVWCDQLPDDFMDDPINPNIYGLLENVKRSYKAMTDIYGSVVLVNVQLDSKPQHELHTAALVISSSPDSFWLSEGDVIMAGQNDEDSLMADATKPPPFNLVGFDPVWSGMPPVQNDEHGSMTSGNNVMALTPRKTRPECVDCRRYFKKERDLRRHMKDPLIHRKLECAICLKSFHGKRALRRHLKRKNCKPTSQSDVR